MQIKTLAIAGEPQSINNKMAAAYPGLEHKHSIAVGATVRGQTAAVQELALEENSLVELVFEDGVQWLGPSDMLEELYPGGAKRNRDGKDVFEIDDSLQHPDQSRGIGKILLKLVNVFVKNAPLAKTEIKKVAAAVEAKILGMATGLWSVRDNLSFVPLEPLDTTKPILLLLHGTGSSAQSSFEGMPGTALWDYWQATYGKNIVAFQHETLTKSPLENVVDLLKLLPANATLHLISHSRGGLVGEVISRFGQQDIGQIIGFTDVERDLFTKTGQKADADAIDALRSLANNKQYKVEKFIRVACPAAGTTILTKRLDYFINILLNLIGAVTGAGANPAYMALKELLVAVVDQKNDPDVLPGLEAMKPDSLFIRILNSQSEKTIPIVPPVAVVSGNCKVGLNLKSIFVIASKLFYWEDNDLIVNTPSMYCGSKKTNGLQYFFDEGTEVDHFHYFKNKKTNEAIVLAMKAKGTAAIDGFTPFADANLGEGERNAALGLDAVQFFMDNPSGKKPIAVLLPGIMGSSIKQNGDLIWVNYLRFFGGGLSRIGIKEDKIEIPGIISTSYKDLARYLSDDYDVVTFPYDWRKPLTDAADLFNEKIQQLLLLKQPIKIIGHSMGGVLVRDFILKYHDTTWKTLNQSKDFKLVFLGAPLGGSHRILSVLLGQDGLVKKMEKLDIFHNMKDLLEIFSQFPGLLGLLPLTEDTDKTKPPHQDFASGEVWKAIADHIGEDKWHRPSDTLLKDFEDYRNNVVAKQPKIDFSNAVYVAGQDRFTPCDYSKDTTPRGNELTIWCTAEGDQCVTWNSGIPTQIRDNKNAYYVNVIHGNLASEPSLFSGIRELLAKGETNLLSRNRPSVRSNEKLFVQPEVFDFDLSPRGLENAIMGRSTKKTKAAAELPVKVKVSYGDLKYADYPLLAGHFKNDSILFAEKRINDLLHDLLAERHAIGLYPGDIGTSEILLTQQTEGFAGAIITGLGEPGTLNSFGLTRSVEQAVARYLLMINGRDKIKTPLQHKTPLGISSLIIGCGYGGLSIENSISAILEGILLANNKIKNLYHENAKQIEQVQFVELYEDRLLACYYTVQQLCNQEGGLMNITKERDGIEKLHGGRKRISLLQIEEWWNRIEVRAAKDSKGKVKGMSFMLGGNRAGQDQRQIYPNTQIVEKLAKVISTDSRWDLAKARALYELLVPHDFKDEVKKYGNIIWMLDEYMAGFPWELLHDKTTGARPLCIDSGMVRQLILEEGKGRTKIDMVRSKTALVVGDPNLKGFATQLPGAREEAKLVVQLLQDYQYDVKPLLFSSPEEIIPALFSEDYKIIHLAGHGEFNEDPDKDSGMIIGDNVFLTTAEIAQVSGTSELVFVNCCFLGQTDGQAEARYQNRYKLAANIGTQLIRNGVKAVVVAGWAIDDTAALDFAKRFYTNMFEGYTFGDAVRMAREEIYKKHGNTNTWGAYQCYGDPFYRLLNDRDKQVDAKRRYVLPEQAEVDLFNLLSDLKTADPSSSTQWHEDRLKQIIAEVEKYGLRNQAITEKEAFLYIQLNKPTEAVAQFMRLKDFEDASYSFMAIEQYYNLLAKQLYQQADAFEKNNSGNKVQFDEIEAEFNGVTKGLNALIDIRPTAERYSLLGGTYKKMLGLCTGNANVLNGQLKAAAGNPKKVQELSKLVADNTEKIKEQLKLATDNYYLAYRHSPDTDAIYPFANWVALQCLRVNAGWHKWKASKEGEQKATKPQNPEEIRQHLESLQKKADQVKNSGSYFDAIAPANIAFCRWLLTFTDDTASDADKDMNKVIDKYQNVWGASASEADKKNEMNHLGALQKGAGIAKAKAMAKALKELISTLGG